MKLKILPFFCLVLGISPLAMAKTPEDSSKKPGYKVSFVAVGAASDSYWARSEDEMSIVDLDPGATPPHKIYISASKDSGQSNLGGNKEKTAQTQLILNNPTARVKIIGSECNITAKFQRKDTSTQTPFTSFTLPKKLDSFTVFLAREPKAKDWSDPQQLIMSDSVEKFPLGSSRIINLSDRPILVERGGRKLGVIAPKKSAILKKSLNLKKSETITLSYKHKGRKISCFRRTLRFPKTARVNITCTYVPKRSRPVLSQLFTTSTH